MNKYSRHLTYSFTSSYGLVRDWVIKKMNLDEQIFKRVDKTILIQLVNQNVTIPNQLNIQKGQFLLPFFFAPLKNVTMYLQCMFNVLCFGEFLLP